MFTILDRINIINGIRIPVEVKKDNPSIDYERLAMLYRKWKVPNNFSEAHPLFHNRRYHRRWEKAMEEYSGKIKEPVNKF